MSIKLNKKNLEQIESKGHKIPKYDNTSISAGIVHFGVGNFHRAHQAVYLNRLFNKGLDKNWGIVGAGVMPYDEKMREALENQDYLFSVVEQSANDNNFEVVGSIIDYLSVNDKLAIIEKLSQENIKIVSLTITEGGYFIDYSTGLFDDKNPSIIEDAKSLENPKTVFGLILAALKRRKENNIEPFTVMSCDNIPHNGVVTKNTLVGLANMIDNNFADWIKQNVAFPNGMVDRITPATTQRERDSIVNNFQVSDEVPVFCEDFIQWVLEDNFPLGRPALEKVGVEFVEDVTPYENMKIRILNGGHAVIAYISGLLDIDLSYEAMRDPLVLEYLRKVEKDEIIPNVPAVPNTNIAQYYKKIEERFSNPKIEDSIRRLCLDGTNRQPKFIIPTIADCIKNNIDFKGLALESALWCRYCYGTTESGATIEANDPNWDELHDIALKAKDNPTLWLDMKSIYGEIGMNSKFRDYFTKSLTALHTKGVRAVVQEYIAGK